MSVAPSLGTELDLLIEAAAEASEVALGFYGKDPRVWTKAGGSPVTEADIAVDEHLRKTLLGKRPGYGYLSEESDDDGTRLTAARTFIVDPIDGTRSFIAGGTDWTIPIAVVEAGRPIAAVLVAPARGEHYHAIRGGGATRDGAPIAISGRRELEDATLAVSQRILKSEALQKPIRARTVFHASLAYRLARVADGRLDGAAIKPQARDWDLAAADLLVHESGGLLRTLAGAAPRYDRPETAHDVLIAGGPALSAALADTIAAAIKGGL